MNAQDLNKQPQEQDLDVSELLESEMEEVEGGSGCDTCTFSCYPGGLW